MEHNHHGLDLDFHGPNDLNMRFRGFLKILNCANKLLTQPPSEALIQVSRKKHHLLIACHSRLTIPWKGDKRTRIQFYSFIIFKFHWAK